MTINNDGTEIGSAPVGEVANFWSRLMAFVIDLVLLFFFMVMLLTLTGLNVVRLSGHFVDMAHIFRVVGNWFFWVMLGSSVAGMGYFCLMHAWCGRTIGKKIMGIRLVACDDDGLNVGICFLRWVGYFASALPLFFGFLWAMLDVEGRTWHDRLVGTRVLYG